eukprot:gene10028-13701_t
MAEAKKKGSHHLKLWASVATGLEDVALAEITAVLEPSTAPRSVPGQVLFCVAAERDAAEIAGRLALLRACGYVCAKI